MTRRLRILHFAQDSDTSGYFPQLARWRNRERLDMMFGTLRDTDERVAGLMRDAGVPTFSCGAVRRLAYPLAILNLARALRRERVDVLHVHLFDPSVVGLLAGWIARTPVRVQTRHYSDCHTRLGRRWHVKLDQLCARLAHAVIAVSRHTADHMTRVEHVPASKVEMIPNGIDFDRVRVSAPDAPGRLRAELGIPGGLLLLTVGRLHPEKGLDHLFDALAAAVPRVDVPLRLVIAGAGPYEGVFRERVRNLGLGEQVRFLGFRHDVPDLLAAADLFVLPSVAEAFGLAIAEALFLGTPLLASRCGGIPELVDDGRDGILVPPGDAQALTEALVAMLTDADRRRALAGAGRDKIRRRFAFEGMVRAYEALYDRLAPA